MKRKYVVSIAILALITLGYIKLTSINKTIKNNYNVVSSSWKTVDKQLNLNPLNIEDKYIAINRYNEAVQEYNTSIGIFPNNLIAKAFNYSEAPYFTGKSEDVPIVDFKK